MTVRELCKIVDIYGIEYILRQLAEESMELAHAALKLIRANRHETPDTLEDAMDALTEEAADVYVMLSVLSAILGDDYRQCVQNYLETERKPHGGTIAGRRTRRRRDCLSPRQTTQWRR